MDLVWYSINYLYDNIDNLGVLGLKKWLFFITFGFTATIIAEEDSCISCHLDQDEGEILVEGFLSGIHANKNIGCAGCHGGDPEAFDDEDEAMWDVDDFLSDITKHDQLEMCGKCHSSPKYMMQFSASIKTDQVSQYKTSKHGESLISGNEKGAICTDCHSVHGVLSVDDPRSTVYPTNLPTTCGECHSNASYMEGTDLPTDQFEKYQNSVHGKALLEHGDIGSPACNDCHGNHGATPPDISHVKDICGTCHINNRDLFQNSHLFSALAEGGFAQCSACHNNHEIIKPDDTLLDWSDNSLCRQCHPEGGEAKLMADHFYNLIDSLKTSLDQAQNLVKAAEQKGMVVSDLLFDLDETRKTLIHTRTNIHSFNIDYVDSNAVAGFKAAQAAMMGANASLNEFGFRQKGLFLFSFIITFLVLVLGIKIKGLKENN